MCPFNNFESVQLLVQYGRRKFAFGHFKPFVPGRVLFLNFLPDFISFYVLNCLSCQIMKKLSSMFKCIHSSNIFCRGSRKFICPGSSMVILSPLDFRSLFRLFLVPVTSDCFCFHIKLNGYLVKGTGHYWLNILKQFISIQTSLVRAMESC